MFLKLIATVHGMVRVRLVTLIHAQQQERVAMGHFVLSQQMKDRAQTRMGFSLGTDVILEMIITIPFAVILLDISTAALADSARRVSARLQIARTYLVEPWLAPALMMTPAEHE